MDLIMPGDLLNGEGLILTIVLFILSCILLSAVGSSLYVGVLLLVFALMKKLFRMNGDKWHSLFLYKRGKGLYAALIVPYVIMMVIMYPVSVLWFEWLMSEYVVAGPVTVLILLAFTLIIRLPQMKYVYRDIYNE